MRILTTKFENLRMLEDETIGSYYEKVATMANEAQALGDPFSNEKLVSKMMRTLPERFNIKTSSIEEARDVSCLEIAELVNILTTYEMNLNEQKQGYKTRGIALQATTSNKQMKEKVTTSSTDDSDSDNELLDEELPSLALLTKRVNALIKTVQKGGGFKPRRLFQTSSSNSSSDNTFSRDDENLKGGNVDHIQCRGCSRMGHYARECPTVLRKKKLNFSTTLSDESDN